MGWRRTGVAAAALADGQPREASAGATSLVLLRTGSTVAAFEGACPHLGGNLAEGWVADGRLTCPLHGAGFDPITGAVRVDPFGVEPPQGEVQALRAFPTRVTDGEVEVDVPDEGAG